MILFTALEGKEINSLGIVVADHISAMLAYWDKNLVCRFANAAYREWFGINKDEMIGKITLIELLGPLYPLNAPYINGALAGETQIFEREIPTPDGSLRYALANYYPDIKNDEVVGFFVHVADISSIKKLELDLVKSNQKVIDQNKSLLNFAFIVSHNLRTYSSNLDSILQFYAEADTEESKKELFEHLLSISNNFSTTVDHLTQIVRAQSQGNTRPELINLREYIDKVKESLAIQMVHNNAVINNNVEKDIVIRANAAYMESIILNFLTNALKYQQPGRPLMVELGSTLINNEIKLSIKDNGLGIDLSRHGENLFGMYKTFHGNEDAQGIGLFIAKNQIESMDGRVEVESEVGEGTTFHIYFPVA